MTDIRAQVIARETAKPGMRGRVNAMCVSCIYDPKSGLGTWRQQVGLCACNDCPLFDIRPTAKEAAA
jgi:hypothetical protein